MRIEKTWRLGAFLFGLVVTACAACDVFRPLLASGADFTNSAGMEFVFISPGAFIRERRLIVHGDSSAGGAGRADSCTVTISRPFYLGRYEVTREQWYSVMQIQGKPEDAERPAQVSWNDAQEFIRRLNQKEGHVRYRLPTEAEWEYAASAGAGVPFFVNANAHLADYAWFRGNSGLGPSPVGLKAASPWGLYDIYGNVWEWVQDWFGEYPAADETDPVGPAAGTGRVARGCSWKDDAVFCQSSARSSNAPGVRFDCVGFRLAFSPE
ncbi:formylglycine-generating enzyme family protein [Nitratidesulfovibrio termitidis]|uniref:formylglycine-generating enzyme family protein n=1 Tax=Nitratidesulfovibrio termitidis TaxID=42252 RepID=UPI000A007A6E|nr:formylglycine-generating enzyme family protein [Nitratidesulfovibrio termitidis]